MSKEFREQLIYEIIIEGLPQQLQQVTEMERQLERSNAQFVTFQRNLSMARMAIRDINAARLAVQQFAVAIRTLNIGSFMYALLNVMQVMYTTIAILQSMIKMQIAAASAQAALDILMGRPYLIPLALAGAGLAYAMLSRTTRSRYYGGMITETGWWYLHQGEYVMPRTTVNRMGPFIMNVSQAPVNPREMMRGWAYQEVNAGKRRWA